MDYRAVELHSHLYGYLNPEDIWELGRDRWTGRVDALDWYAREFEAATARRPDWKTYWHSTNGLHLLSQDFCMTEPSSFAVFQAKFNLMIALLPLVPGDCRMIYAAAKRAFANGVRFVEWRTLLPSRFSESESRVYLDALTKACAQIESLYGRELHVRLAMSLPRPPAEFERMYRTLRTWMDAHTTQSIYITAIDLCGAEEGDPPAAKAALFAIVRADNASRDPAQQLRILHHVGESFVGLSLMSAARRVFQAFTSGADRLGHALALGTSTPAPQPTHQDLEAAETTQWIEENKDTLRDFGFDAAKDFEDTKKFQIALQKWLASMHRKPVIECCPTSNYLIAGVAIKQHPLFEFISNGLDCIIASDDPGLMKTSLKQEHEWMHDSHRDIKMIQKVRQTTARLVSEYTRGSVTVV